MSATPTPWAFDADAGDITLHNTPIFKVYREWDFPCIEDEDRAEADLEYLTHATVAVMLLNTIATTESATVGEAIAAKLAAYQPMLEALEAFNTRWDCQDRADTDYVAQLVKEAIALAKGDA